LDRLPGPHAQRLGRPDLGWGFDSWVFNQALGELRGQFGVYLGELAEGYGFKVDGQLAAILPPPPSKTS